MTETNNAGNKKVDPLAGVGSDRRAFLGLVLAGSAAAVPLVTSVGLSGAVAATGTPNVSGATTTRSSGGTPTTTSSGTVTTTTTAAPEPEPTTTEAGTTITPEDP